MKKYLFGVFALATALTFAAFKPSTSNFAKFTQQNPANLTASTSYWVESSSLEGCDQGDVSVCFVEHPSKSFLDIRADIMSTSATTANGLESALKAIDNTYSIVRKDYQP